MAGSKISALTAISTVDDTDLFPIVDTSATTLNKMTRAQLRKLIADSPTDLASLRYSTGSADWLVTTPSAMITGLPAITTLAGADVLPINQSTTGSKVTVTQLRAQLPLASPADGDMIRYNSVTSTWDACTPDDLRWKTVATSRYTTTIGATYNNIAMSNTSGMVVGCPVKYVRSGTTYYGIIVSVTTNTSIVIYGPYLAAASVISALKVGTPEMVIVKEYYVSGAYGDGVNDLLAADMKMYRSWDYQRAYLCQFRVRHNTDAATSQPKVNVKLAGSSVATTAPISSSSTAAGVTVLNGIWSTTVEGIDSATYGVAYNGAIEITCGAAGNPTGGALDLSVQCVFVLE